MLLLSLLKRINSSNFFVKWLSLFSCNVDVVVSDLPPVSSPLYKTTSRRRPTWWRYATERQFIYLSTDFVGEALKVVISALMRNRVRRNHRFRPTITFALPTNGNNGRARTIYSGAKVSGKFRPEQRKLTAADWGKNRQIKTMSLNLNK